MSPETTQQRDLPGNMYHDAPVSSKNYKRRGSLIVVLCGNAFRRINIGPFTTSPLQVCAISNERLREPVVACELGYLYNKVSPLKERQLASSHVPTKRQG